MSTPKAWVILDRRHVAAAVTRRKGNQPTSAVSRRRLRACAGLALLTLGLSLSATSLAQETSPEKAVLKVGVSPIFPPMVFKQGKELAGVEVDLARALGKHLERSVEFVELPWEGQIEALQTKRIDIIMSSMSVTPARAFVIDFSQSYLTIGQSPLVRREDQNAYALGIPYNSNDKVGVLKATTGEFLVKRDFPKMACKVFRSEADAVKALQKKKIDLFIADSTLVWYLAGMHANDGLAAVPMALTKEQVAWGVRKGDESLLTAANEFIQKASKDGTMNQVARRWMAVPR
jgi:ABC-type amino acid transport substrate-binding protein